MTQHVEGFLADRLAAIQQQREREPAKVVSIERALQSAAATGNPLIDAERTRAMQQHAKDRAAARQRWLALQCESSGIPARHAKASFSGYVAPTEPQARALDVCRRFAVNFSRARENGANLLLLGSPGTGKTHLAAAIARTVLAAGMAAVFTREADLLRRLRATFQAGAELRDTDVIARFVAPDLLVIDEAGVSIGNPETRRAMLYDVLNGRYESLRPTIVISNLTEQALAKHLGERAWDRLTDTTSAVVRFDWPSYRQQAHPKPPEKAMEKAPRRPSPSACPEQPTLSGSSSC